MEQLIFELAAPEPPSFANFLVGSNREAVAVLRRMASGDAAETGLVLWGPPGVGKSHLLRAAAAAGEGNRPIWFQATPADLPDDDPQPRMLVLVDDVDHADATLQARLFTVYNALKATGGSMVATSSLPPARMPLREDLRSRLGWGLVHEVLPLADKDKPQALASYAHARGFALTDEVIAYLLAHGRRDMPSLVATLAALDRHSLASKRPITLPLLREWMQQGLSLSGGAAGQPPP